MISGGKKIIMKKHISAPMILIILSACAVLPSAPAATTVPSSSPFPPATVSAAPVVTATQTFISTESPTPIPDESTHTSTPAPIDAAFCSDTRVTDLIDAFSASILTKDGALLSSLVNPKGGMEARLFRTGNVLTYSQAQAKFLFETTYQADWGTHPASGESVVGAFHEVVVPELEKIFSQPYTLHCNELRHGGATYEPGWEYEGDFYTVYFPGTEQYGFLDWQAWAIGIERVGDKPYIYALTQFFWEP
jgi:hypothetical protein